MAPSKLEESLVSRDRKLGPIRCVCPSLIQIKYDKKTGKALSAQVQTCAGEGYLVPHNKKHACSAAMFVVMEYVKTRPDLVC